MKKLIATLTIALGLATLTATPATALGAQSTTAAHTDGSVVPLEFYEYARYKTFHECNIRGAAGQASGWWTAYFCDPRQTLWGTRWALMVRPG